MERQLVEMTKYLIAFGVSIRVAVLNKPGPFSKELSTIISKEVEYLDRRKHRIPWIIWSTAKTCREDDISLIHVQDSFSAFYGLLISSLARIKFVNGMIRHAGVSSGIDYYWEKLLLSLSDKILSNSIAGLMFYGVQGSVIYNFINTKRFEESNQDLSRIVMTASFSDYKDQATLLQAGFALHKEGRITQIAFIGDGKNFDRMVNKANDLGLGSIVKFYKGILNVEETICKYGIGVLCSTKRYKEGVSNAILEYMGSGLIAVGSNLGGIPEIITDSVNGFLFEAEDDQSLYLVLKHIQDNSQDMDMVRQNAIETLNDKFNPEKNCKQLYRDYLSLTDK
jgi:glycosyltransferase involved in cell wall biosynthesis